MNKISVCLKSVICALVCISMSLSIILINTSKLLGYSDSTMFILGGVCGIIIAVITKGDTLKKTILARFVGIFSAVIAQLALCISYVPYYIVKLIYGKHDLSFYGEEAERWFRDIEHFIENEVSIYNWCAVFFLYSLIALFCAAIIVSFIINKIKNHVKRG
ncbi:MAG: hypothetical protein LIP16_07765 [Clostridium sp.]|nr:hypothetical protein [Clostridium sp.]